MSTRAWTLFGALSVIWGVPYLFIKIADDGGATPGLLALARVALGAAVLLALALRAGGLSALRAHWLWLAVYAVAEIVIPFPAIAAGEQRIPSSLAAIIIACVPLLVVLLEPLFGPTAPVGRRRITGLVIGLTGVVALVGVDASAHVGTLVGAAETLLGAVGYAIGPIVLKRHLATLDPRAMMGASLAIAALILVPVALLDAPARVPSAGALASIVALGLVCTALGFALMAVLVVDIGPSRALVIAYINPVVAVALGVVFLSEHPGALALAGLALILAGSWLATGGRLRARVAAARP